MRSDRDNRTKGEKEIDDFLSQFETPVEDISTDIDRYLNNSGESAHVGRADRRSASQPSSYAQTKHVQNEAYAASRESSPQEPEKPDRKKRKNSDKPKSKRRNRSAASDSNASHLKYRLFYKENPDYVPGKGEYVMVNGKKRKNKPYKISIKKLLLDCVALGAAMCILAFLYAFITISFAPKINANDIYDAIERSSVIYDDQGKEVDSVYYSQDRTLIKYDDCPEDLINAFVALEDKTFWKHHGFNWTRMVGAVVSSLTGGGRISGTSTITQQLSRNVYLADVKSERSIKRKILEMYYAAQIEKCLSKEEIIEAYLNTIYLGFGCYGVDAAAHAYYSKEVSELSLVECASLAALPQAPDTYALVQYVSDANLSEDTTNIIIREPDTYVANDIAKGRRDTCLNLMKEQGYITEDEYNKAYNKDLIDFIKPTIDSGNSNYAYFHEYLIDQVVSDLMEEYNLSYAEAESMVYTKGLKIYSTIDSEAQKAAVKEFQNPANFPSVMNIRYDADKNIISSNGSILLYDYDDFFNDNNSFVFKDDEARLNSDGSVTVVRGKRLNIYTTQYDGTTDYSLEFKSTYVYDGTLYTYSGGYINIPAQYKTLDGDDNLVISADYFKDYPDVWKVKKDKIVITENGYTLTPKTIQPQAAMAIVGVGTGEVKALVGGRSTKGQRLFNRALNPRQPGSSIKPLAVYGAALQKSFDLAEAGKEWTYTDFGYDRQGTKGYGDYITTASTVADERMVVNGEVWPTNSGGGYSGSVSFRQAIQRSINTCAVKIQLQVGVDYSMELLEKFGLTTLVTSADNATVNDENTAALALGGMTKGVIPLEMALAYATFPAGGTRNSAVAYTKVENSKGEVILESKSEETKVLDEGVAWIMTDVLKSVVTNGLGRPAALSGAQAGGKTGTTSDKYDIWFDGFTQSYAAALWIGTDVNLELTSMSSTTAALWGKIMNQVSAAKEGTYREMPDNVIRYRGEYFTKGTEKGLSKYKSYKDNDKDKDKDNPSKETPGLPDNGNTGGDSGGGNTGGNTGGDSGGGNTGGNTGGDSGGGNTGGNTGGDSGGGNTGGNTGGDSGGGNTGGSTGGDTSTQSY